MERQNRRSSAQNNKSKHERKIRERIEIEEIEVSLDIPSLKDLSEEAWNEIEVITGRNQDQSFKGLKALALLVSTVTGAVAFSSQVFVSLCDTLKTPWLDSLSVFKWLFAAILSIIFSGLVLGRRGR